MLGGLVFRVVLSGKSTFSTTTEEIVKRLKEVKAERKAYKEEHRLRFEALPEQERLESASAMARDAQIYGESISTPTSRNRPITRGCMLSSSAKQHRRLQSPAFVGAADFGRRRR